MRWNARGTVALLVSALVGVAAGAFAGFTTGSSPPVTADPEDPSSSPSPSASVAVDDPLGLDVPLQNLDCTGDTILVVGWGATRPVLSNAVSANKEAGVRYLETANSCNTLYGAERQDPPAYAAYLGPFDSLAEPCSLRMSVDHKSDVVTSLKPGVRIHVQCLCVLDPATFPTLAVGMESDTRTGIYVRSMQRLLVDIDQNPDHHITGEYDAETRDLITPLQELNAIDVDPDGIVEKLTWQMLRDRACVTYDF